VVLTGASSGLGQNLSVKFAKQDVNIIGTGRDQSGLASVECSAVIADLSKQDAIDLILEACNDRDVGVVVLNAGLSWGSPVANQTDDEISQFLYMMGSSCSILMREFQIRLQKRPSKSCIVVVASVAARSLNAMTVLYYGAKAYVSRMVQHLQFETTGTNVQFTAIHPGYFFGDSRLFQAMPDSFGPFMTIVNHIVAQSQDVAEATLRTMGKTGECDVTWDGIAMRALQWAIGEPLLTRIGRKLFSLIYRYKYKSD
jgi:short-subunit dehydrogenase